MKFGVRAGGAMLAVLAGAGVVAALSYACVDLDSLGNGSPRDSGAPNGEGGPIEGGPVDPCEHTGPPPKPAFDPAPGAKLPPFVVAFDQVTVDPTRIPGFDIDGLCTCDERPNVDGGASCVGGQQACDGPGGIDNVAASIASQVSGLSFDTFPNRLIANGKRTLLLRISDYNGKANDEEVSVGALVAEGIREASCPSSELDTETGFYRPGRCGNDPWTLSPTAVYATGSQLVPTVLGKGWVNDFHLVVTFGNPVEIPFTEVASVKFYTGLITGRLVPLKENLEPRDPSTEPTAEERRLFRVDQGVVAGRVGTNDLLRSLGTYVSRFGPICKEAVFSQARGQICAGVDIKREPTYPADPQVRCDALSAAFGFTALPARESVISDAGTPPDPCADAGPVFDCP